MIRNINSEHENVQKALDLLYRLLQWAITEIMIFI